ncbi:MULTISPECIES: magnesium/cobalt transporter CorA [Pontibacillus]|uniref:Magnesium transport protein CorA n=1 Tax=Pontibacillus chungwhensis TaxID=265426 RepID=A0ABY8V1R9_9BACI|nr:MULTISPECIES: magnesium/cobalt transporter CorA [Pontibacillus]MCD5322456.1 magnesium/cobalt transporter CorA [Pontibacillus sp. HN14]WIF99742.1 magnesium/cobalt transporter CorA [Pontibacillus chungwhensis]
MIRTIAITEDQQLHTDLPLENLSEEGIMWYWVDFSEPTPSETQKLDTVFQFHPLAIEDCIHNLQRPKLDYYDEHTFFVMHALNAKTLEKEEVDLFNGDGYIVTYHKHVCPELEQVWNRLLRERSFKSWDEFHVLHQIFDKVVDNYFPIVYAIEDHINDIEDNTKELSMETLLEQLFDTRADLLSMRQTVHPMRDLMYRILSSHRLDGVRERKEYFSDIYDHLLKVSELIESNREMTQDIRDSYMSLNSHETNRTMQILTVISTIFMPLTFIVGVYGMNFAYMPELDEKYAYFVVLAIMFVIAIIMFLWFKRKGWFD